VFKGTCSPVPARDRLFGKLCIQRFDVLRTYHRGVSGLGGMSGPTASLVIGAVKAAWSTLLDVGFDCGHRLHRKPGEQSLHLP